MKKKVAKKVAEACRRIAIAKSRSVFNADDLTTIFEALSACRPAALKTLRKLGKKFIINVPDPMPTSEDVPRTTDVFPILGD